MRNTLEIVKNHPLSLSLDPAKISAMDVKEQLRGKTASTAKTSGVASVISSILRLPFRLRIKRGEGNRAHRPVLRLERGRSLTTFRSQRAVPITTEFAHHLRSCSTRLTVCLSV